MCVCRFLLVVHRQRMGRPATALALAGLLLGALAVTAPDFLVFRPEQTADGWEARETAFGRSHGRWMYEVWVQCIILIVLPWVTVAGLNIAIVRQVLQLHVIVRMQL
jgi:hypothetical protein